MRRLLSALSVPVLAAVLSIVSLSPVAAAPNSPPNYYLAMGDSLAAGYQPGLGVDKTGGYVGVVWRNVKATFPRTNLNNIGCPGETTTTLITGGVCNYPTGNQLAEGLAFLAGHRQSTKLITIDIGANDVQRCVSQSGQIDFTCLNAGIAAIQTNLPSILGQLHRAAPNAQIVVLNYYDPFLAAYLLGTPEGIQLARLSVGLSNYVNGIIAGAAATVNATMSDIFTAFQTANWTPITVPVLGTVPTNVAMICQYTWMCALHDIHANNAGYTLMGVTTSAVVTGLGGGSGPVR